MLDEIELFVRSGRPKVVPRDSFLLFGDLAIFGNNSGATLLTERGIGEDDIKTVTRISSLRITND